MSQRAVHTRKVKPLPLSDCPCGLYIGYAIRLMIIVWDWKNGNPVNGYWAIGNAYSIRKSLCGWTHALHLILVGHWIMYYLLMRGVSLD